MRRVAVLAIANRAQKNLDQVSDCSLVVNVSRFSRCKSVMGCSGRRTGLITTGTLHISCDATPEFVATGRAGFAVVDNNDLDLDMATGKPQHPIPWSSYKPRALRVAFVHPDLGIG